MFKLQEEVEGSFIISPMHLPGKGGISETHDLKGVFWKMVPENYFKQKQKLCQKVEVKGVFLVEQQRCP